MAAVGADVGFVKSRATRSLEKFSFGLLRDAPSVAFRGKASTEYHGKASGTHAERKCKRYRARYWYGSL